MTVCKRKGTHENPDESTHIGQHTSTAGVNIYWSMTGFSLSLCHTLEQRLGHVKLPEEKRSRQPQGLCNTGNPQRT